MRENEIIMRMTYKNTPITLMQGDITQLKVEAIVNAANSSLLGGGGVDGAIHRAGGPKILEECMAIRAKQGGCQTGEAVITTAGHMAADYVIHTVGPVWYEGKRNEAEDLQNCYKNCLKLAEEKCIKTIAFPNISTGVYRFPKELAAALAIKSVKNYLETSTMNFEHIIWICFDTENTRIYKRLLSAD